MRGPLKALLLLFLLVLIALATLPWWLGALLRPLARAQGVSFARYETIGYARFRLHEVKLSRPSFAFSARHVTLDSPAAWLLRRARAHSEIFDWSLRLTPSTAPAEPTPPPSPPMSPARVHAQSRQVLDSLRRWLPRATAENGRIERGEQKWQVSRATWADGVLRVEALLPTGKNLHATLTEKGEALLAAAELPSFATRAELAWTARALHATGTWHAQPIALEARFDDASWIPTDAELRAENWDVPATLAKLGPAYARVRGQVLARWTKGSFTADVRAAATPATEQKAPPFELVAQATGDRRHVVVRTLQVQAPFATATLSAPLTFAFDGRSAAESALLAIRADLSQQPWFEAAGKITGEIRITPRGADSRGDFTAQIEGFQWRQFAARSGNVRGHWQGRRVQVDEAAFTLDADSRVTARGAWDSATRELRETRIDATLASAWAAPLLAKGLAFEKIVAAIELEGPLASVRHRGELNASKFRASRLRPLDVAAHWSGAARTFDELVVSARSGNSALQLAGSLAENRATLREFILSRAGREVLRGVSPAEFSWTPHWKISGVRLEGGERALALDGEWNDAPSFFVSAQQLPSEWLGDWWSGEILPSRIDALNARGRVHDGVLIGEATLEAAAHVEGAWLQGRLATSAQREGIRVQQLEFADARGVMAYASGRVPVRLVWPRTPHVELDAHAPLEVDAAVAPDSPLWEVVRRHAGLTIEGGAIVASLSGSLEQPRGLVRLDAARIARTGAGNQESPSLHAITDLAGTIRGERNGLQLEALEARVAGHAVRASGQLPMDDAAWRTLFRSPREFDWRRAEVQLSAPRLELVALAQTFPALPFTDGTLEAEVRLARGEITGTAALRGGASRPLPGLGRLLAIEADLALAGRSVEFRTFSARLGGEPVELTGTAALGDRNRLDLDLRLQAKNVPLVRQPGLLVRTDLDLRAQTPARGPTRISGRVDLRDALVLADLAAILPGGPRGGSRAPPYFSVGAAPFSRWPLDVQIGGLRAVRVRTAVFNGVATPQFHLTGTLGDPRAIGQLSVEAGQVLFPFARFAVQQGTVRLTAADPTQLQLAVNATAKRMGYELRLEAGGTTAAPTLAFSSNPPLESADILLLVTTGQPPQNDALATAGPTNQQRLTRLGTFLGSGIFQNFSGTEDRLEFTSGEQISESGRETYRAEYKLTEKLSVIGEYDQYDDYNAGVSYRIYTKEGAKREERK